MKALARGEANAHEQVRASGPCTFVKEFLRCQLKRFQPIIMKTFCKNSNIVILRPDR